MRRPGIAVTYMVFDLLSLDEDSLLRAPYSERRAQLEALDLNGVFWQTPETFDDGEALCEAVCAHDLEGVVAKRRTSTYRPGERGWVKTKNRGYWRYDLERESAINRPRVKQFV
jgi:bifunctional non-homologous end joining protein LigD